MTETGKQLSSVRATFHFERCVMDANTQATRGAQLAGGLMALGLREGDIWQFCCEIPSCLWTLYMLAVKLASAFAQ